jgi:rfaE bifunctional protein nucleotidyltransferase chain/domain
MNRLSYVENKICSIENAVQKIAVWKLKGEKIVFTNGCFDILHKGHVTYLAKAADLGTKMVVALNTDSSVKKLGKGDERPINDEKARLTVLASLGFIDLVILFNEDTPLEIITALQPNILVKGADYDPKEVDPSSKKYIVGSDIVKQKGGIVEVISLVDGFSTTGIVNKLKS